MSDESAEPKLVEKKKGKGKLIGILVALALVVGAGVAGAVVAPKYLAGQAQPPKAEEEDGEHASDEAEPASGSEGDSEHADTQVADHKSKDAVGDVHEVQNLEAIVVDTRSADGSIRHVKVGITIELTEKTKEADFKPYVPRAREAAIAYFRTRDFEQLSDPKKFSQVVKDLNKEVIAAVGKKRAKRIVVTDFVAQ